MNGVILPDPADREASAAEQGYGMILDGFERAHADRTRMAKGVDDIALCKGLSQIIHCSNLESINGIRLIVQKITCVWAFAFVSPLPFSSRFRRRWRCL